MEWLEVKEIKSKIIEGKDGLISRQFLIKGTVVGGNKLGQKIGFKTANIRPLAETTIFAPCDVGSNAAPAFTLDSASTLQAHHAYPATGSKAENAHPARTVQASFGVYQAETKICSTQKIYRSIVNFGIRPSIKREIKEPIAEVHILDGFCSDIYGEEIEVRFVKKIRDELSFASLDELKEQINRDIESIQ
ncbi:hypothetical protein FACS1894122_09560 [Alphaproteobacteria bacterium]|nr:hypothetical protein FACS1894122_09560 [Alphaproteobacteria bacterium]